MSSNKPNMNTAQRIVRVATLALLTFLILRGCDASINPKEEVTVHIINSFNDPAPTATTPAL